MPLWDRMQDQAVESYAAAEVFNMESSVRVEAIENLGGLLGPYGFNGPHVKRIMIKYNQLARIYTMLIRILRLRHRFLYMYRSRLLRPPAP